MQNKTDSRSLQEMLDATPNLVEYFYNDTLAPHAKDRGALSPVPPEFTNWRDEQHAWRDSAILFDQSHHMPEMYLKGPDAFKLLNYLGINSFENFVPGKAKQYLACNHDGYVIGECVLQYLDEESFELISGMHLQNWVEYNARTGGYDVTIERDLQSSQNPKGPDGRTRFRFGMDGPNAETIFQEAVEGEAPSIPFFNFRRVKIAGCDVIALRHGMAGHKGVELSGAYADGPKVREALLAIGKKHGLVRGGARTYFSAVTESGWMPYPLPAVYTDEKLRAYREWLPASGWEGSSQLGGSFVSDNIEDYYVTPWDLGVERVMKFDHDFIGREALEKMASEPRRTRVTLVWNKEDVAKIFQSLLQTEELPYKYLDMPVGYYAFQQSDAVRTPDGKLAGLAAFCGYTGNEGEVVSHGMIGTEHAQVGTELVLTWGEPNGGSRKPHVERHRQTSVRVTVAPAPFAKTVREMQRANLGAKAKAAR